MQSSSLRFSDFIELLEFAVFGVFWCFFEAQLLCISPLKGTEINSTCHSVGAQIETRPFLVPPGCQWSSGSNTRPLIDVFCFRTAADPTPTAAALTRTHFLHTPSSNQSLRVVSHYPPGPVLQFITL